MERKLLSARPKMKASKLLVFVIALTGCAATTAIREGQGDAGTTPECVAGETQPCFVGDPALAGVGACANGTQECVGLEMGMWDTCHGSGAPSAEECDGVDNDCNGVVDDGCECRPGDSRNCGGSEETDGLGLCHAGHQACDGSLWGECQDEVLPGTESCDGTTDEDCDGRIDEGCDCVAGDARDCYGGAPETAEVGDCHGGTQTCTAGGWGACEGQALPGSEACTGGRDEDCDGMIDCDDTDCEIDPACCTAFDDTVSIVPPDAEIMFVVDRSGSMDWPALGTTHTRWQELRSAMDAVLPSLEDLPLGLLTFPRLTGDAERLNCMVDSTPDLPIDFGDGDAISARLLTVDPRAGDTPTPQAFATVQSYFESATTSRQRFVILATDGLPEPNCGSTVPATVTAIENLHALGVDTFVIGIVGPDPSGSTAGITELRDGLNQIADAGGRARDGATRYYEAVDGPALTRALRAVLAAATDCRVALDSTPSRPDAIEVRQNDVLVPASGWILTGDQLELTGSWCDAIRGGSVTSISVSDSCH